MEAYEELKGVRLARDRGEASKLNSGSGNKESTRAGRAEESSGKGPLGEVSTHTFSNARGAAEEAGYEHLYELPFDQFQRYKCVQDIVALITRRQPLRVLDVGGYPGLISEFLPQEETYILDVMQCDLANYVQGDGTTLPFKDNSFDVVTSLDVYEHIAVGERQVFIDELCRVSRDFTILSAPFKSSEVELAEQLLYDYVVRVFGEFPTLREHLVYGLPELDGLLSRLEAKGCSTANFSSGHLYNWLTMMLIKHYVVAVLNSEKIQREVDKLYNLNFSPVDYGSPSYRQVVVVSKKGGSKFLQQVLERFRPTKMSSDEVALKMQLFQVLIDLLNLQVNQQVTAQEAHISTLEKDMRSRNKEITNLVKELQDKEKSIQEMAEKSRLDGQHIENLERFVEKVKKTLPYRIYSLLHHQNGR
jgi:SAM-dependent methyltransferase